MQIIIHERGGLPLINGVEFKPGKDGWSSGPVDDEVAALFAGVDGYRMEQVGDKKVTKPADTPPPAGKGGKGSKKAAQEPAPAPAEGGAEGGSKPAEGGADAGADGGAEGGASKGDDEVF